MLIIDTRESDSLDKALKKYKKKFGKSGVLKELRGRQGFTKPSIKLRQSVKKAIYRDQIIRELEG